MKTHFHFYSAACAAALALCAPSLIGATPEPEFEILRTIEFEAPFETSAREGFHLALDPVGGESYLAVPGDLFRFEGPLSETSSLPSIAPGAARLGTLHLSHGRLFYLHGVLAEPDEAGARALYLFSDDGGRSWTSVAAPFFVEEQTQQGTILRYHLSISWMQRRNGLLYNNAGGGENVFVSADNGETWDVLIGERTSMGGSLGARLVSEDFLFGGGTNTIGYSWLARWEMDGDGHPLVGEREPILGGLTHVHAIAEDRRTRSLVVGTTGGVFRSENRGESIDFVLDKNSPVFDESAPESERPLPRIEHLSVCPDYAGRIVAGGSDPIHGDALLLYSDADGAADSWINLSDHVAALGTHVVFIDRDAEGRILVGISHIDGSPFQGQTGTLTIAELKLPDPIRDRFPGVERLGKGWWREAALGTFNAQWYPWQWHADWRGWMWNAEISDSGGHVMWDAEIGWLWMVDDLFPLVWHYESDALVRLDTTRPGRVFQRFADGEWVDVEMD